MPIIFRTAALEPLIASNGPEIARRRRLERALARLSRADESRAVPLALGPIPELILQDQDPPLLFGDLLDLVAQLAG